MECQPQRDRHHYARTTHGAVELYTQTQLAITASIWRHGAGQCLSLICRGPDSATASVSASSPWLSSHSHWQSWIMTGTYKGCVTWPAQYLLDSRDNHPSQQSKRWIHFFTFLLYVSFHSWTKRAWVYLYRANTVQSDKDVFQTTLTGLNLPALGTDWQKHNHVRCKLARSLNLRLVAIITFYNQKVRL